MKWTALVCLSLSLFATDRFQIERGDGTTLVGYYDTPETGPFSIAFILPNSQKETSRRVHDSLKGHLLELYQCPVTLEKKGITEDNIDEKEYTSSLSLQQRLDDHRLALKRLQEGLIPGWDGKIVIVGQGDGGRIGAALAAQTEKVSALILIAAGGAWSPQEEALHSFRRGMASDGYSPQYIHSFLAQAKQEFAQALKTPKPDHKAFGYTYKYWESLLKTNFMNDLSQLKCPIYSVHGDQDSRVPIESVEAMAKHFKDKLTLRRKEKAGREILQDREVYEDAFTWLQTQL